MKDRLLSYISNGWDKTVRAITKKEAEQSADGKLYLPYPYTGPCEENTFQCMYYWDTYFACRGLLLSGKFELVANNIRNFIYLIETYGFIPNGTRKKFLNRSQPPLFGMMLKEYYEATNDKELFYEGLSALEKELDFWYTRRSAKNGLAHYCCNTEVMNDTQVIRHYTERTGVVLVGDAEYISQNLYAEAESGWDFSARFSGKCCEYNAIDLNSIIYFDELLLAKYLPCGKAEKYAKNAEKRRKKMLTLMRGEDGIFYDYSYAENKLSYLKSCASFFPLFVGITSEERGISELLSALELEFGLQTSESSYGKFQWGEENGWACLQLVACEALKTCGRVEDAVRIAKKYVLLVEDCFEKTGHLWEKYNVKNGDANAVGEYGTPTMIGWSAGVYLALLNFLNK